MSSCDLTWVAVGLTTMGLAMLVLFHLFDHLREARR